VYGIINGSVHVNARRDQEAGVPFVLRGPERPDSRVKTFGIIARSSCRKILLRTWERIERRTKKGLFIETSLRLSEITCESCSVTWSKRPACINNEAETTVSDRLSHHMTLTFSAMRLD